MMGFSVYESDSPILGVRSVNSKLAFNIGDNIIFNVQKFQHARGYSIEEIDGKITYIRKKNDLGVVISNNLELETEYESVEQLFEIDGKLIFTAKKDNKLFLVGYDRVLGPYDAFKFLKKIDDQLVLVVLKGSDEYLVINSEERGPYQNLGLSRRGGYVLPASIGGKLTYVVIEDNKTFVYHGDQKFGPYDSVGTKSDSINSYLDGVMINGKLTFRVLRKNAWFVIYGNKEFGPYEDLENINDEFGDERENIFREVNHTLAFIATTKKGSQFIVYDGNEIGKQEYGHVSYISLPAVIHGKIAYRIKRPKVMNTFRCGKNIEMCEPSPPGYETFILYKGQKIGKDFSSLSDPFNIAGKLTFQADTKDGSVVYYGGKILGPYEQVTAIREINGKLTFLAIKKGKGFFIISGGTELGPFNEALWYEKCEMYLCGGIYSPYGDFKPPILWRYDENEFIKQINSFGEMNSKLILSVNKLGKWIVLFEE